MLRRSSLPIRRAAEPYNRSVPYVVAYVELAEGPRVLTNIVECDPESVRIGQRVRARFEAIDDEHTVVLFAAAD